MDFGAESENTYLSFMSCPPCDWSVTWWVDTEFALTTGPKPPSDGAVGEPMIVLRLDFRRSAVSWEDLDRNRLSRLCVLGASMGVDLSEPCWSSSLSSLPALLLLEVAE